MAEAKKRRVTFAQCKPQIGLYEKNVLGESGYKKKSLRFTIVLCGDMEFTCRAVEETMQRAERYELTADLLRNDGIVERFYFHNISLREINPMGEWEFELNVMEEQQRKLSEMAGL